MKRTPLTRKTPMPRMKSNTKAKQRERREQYADSHGIPFDEVELVLGSDHSKWPAVRRVTEDGVLEDYRWFLRPCPLCHRPSKLEPHHLVGGSAGRSNEHANLLAICRGCHNEVQSDANHVKRVWKAKWRTDRWHTDWCRLICLLGRVPFTTLD